MPYMKCTRCGSTTHLNVRDVEAWFKTRYPDLNVGDPVPGYCFDCFPEIKEDCKVRLRLKLGQYQAATGDIGVVQRVYTSESGELYAVKFEKMDKSFTEIFCRPEIAKIKDDESS